MDFDHIGEYVMERMLGSASTHHAMNRQMAAMMGTSGETQAHMFMGRASPAVPQAARRSRSAR